MNQHTLFRIVLVVFSMLFIGALSLSLQPGQSISAQGAWPPPTPIPGQPQQGDLSNPQAFSQLGSVTTASLPLPDSNCADDGQCVFVVSQGTDDAGPNGVPGFGCTYATDWNEVYFGRCENGVYITSGFRFANVAVPESANIAQAYLVFAVDGPYANAVSVELYGDRSSFTAGAGAAPFTATSTPASRLRTTNGARWFIPASDNWQLGEERQTVEIASIVKEITSQGSWSPGKAIAIIARTEPSGLARGQHRRVIGWEREGNTDNTARLVIRLTNSTPCYSVQIATPSGVNNGTASIDTPYNCPTEPGKFLQGTNITFRLNDYDPTLPYSFKQWTTSPGNVTFTRYSGDLESGIKVEGNTFIQASYSKKPVMIVVHGWQGLSDYQYLCSRGARRYLTLRLDNHYYDLMGAMPEAYLQKFDVWMAEWTTGHDAPGTRPLEQNGQCLADQVDAVNASTGNTNDITIVAHSMGGLVTRACLPASECERAVRNVYTLGSPHNGLPGVDLVLSMIVGQSVFGPVCTWQTGVCQLDLLYINPPLPIAFNQSHPTLPGKSYTFIGGYDGQGANLQFWRPFYWLYDDNDGLINRRSAAGFGPTRFETAPSSWKSASQPYTLWVPRAHHTDGMAQGDPRIDADYYFSNKDDDPNPIVPNDPDTISRLTGRAYNCLLWKQGLLGAPRPAYCEDAFVFSRVSRGVAQTSQAQPQTTAFTHSHIQSGQIVSFTVPVDESGQTVFMLGWSQGVLNFTLTQPNGTVVDPAYAQANGSIVQYARTLTPTEWIPLMASYAFTTTQPGLWTLNVSAESVGPSGAAFVAATAFNSERALAVTTNAVSYRPGDTALVQAQLAGPNGDLTGATVIAYIHRATVTDTVVLAEQGDGLYSANYTLPNEPGLLLANVQATGVDDGVPYSREKGIRLAIVAESVLLTGQYSDAVNDADGDGRFDGLDVQVGVNALAAGDYTLHANLEVNGQLVANTAAPVTLSVGTSTVTLSFSGNSLRATGLNGPYTLTNLTIKDGQAGYLPAVSANNVWTTQAYEWSSFGTCHSLTYGVEPVGAGSLNIWPEPDCIGSLGDRYSSDTVVTLTATANEGFTFLGWSGDLDAATTTASLVVSGERDVRAHFWMNQKLRLTALCSPNPASYRVWQVSNPNPYPLNFTWELYGGVTQSGQGLVPAAIGSAPGTVTFQTQTENGANTTRIFVNGRLQDTAPSNATPCP
jgi:pimeloyl-ACP methyl ester carboxylesterase